MHVLHVADVDEAGKEDNRQGRTVILNELSHMPLQQVALAKHAASIGEP